MAEPRRSTTTSRIGALSRALLGGLIMASALGTGTVLGSAIADRVGASGLPARLVPAVLVSAVAVPLVIVAHRAARRLRSDSAALVRACVRS